MQRRAQKIAKVAEFTNCCNIAHFFQINRSSILNFFQYTTDARIKAKWDDLQIDLQCCGGYGYVDYGGTPLGNTNSVPDSCCRRDHSGEGCGAGKITENENKVRQEIYIDGCMER